MTSALANSSSHLRENKTKPNPHHIKLRSAGSYCHGWCAEYLANKFRLQFLELQPFSAKIIRSLAHDKLQGLQILLE